MVNCLLLQRLENCAELCEIEGCERRAEWKFVYQRARYYVCDRHLNAAAERSKPSSRGEPDGKE